MQTDIKSLRIVAAALRRKLNNIVYSLPPPARHHTIMHALVHDGVECNNRFDQGFVTNEGNFVGRIQAMDIARINNQLLDRAPTGPPNTLFSEDVW